MFGVLGTAAGVSAAPVALKAVGELHRMVLQSNVLARQGEGVPAKRGEGEKIARQRTAGLKSGVGKSEPQYMGKVPSQPITGDLRKDYEVGGLGNATSSKGILTDILDKVPRQVHGTKEYKRANRPQPGRAAGFGNQSFTP